jgi:hypothetical protein
VSNVTKHPTAERGNFDKSQTINGQDYDRLWRAQQAATLLASINNHVASEGGISHDSTAAVAEYIRDDMLEILMNSQASDELP